MNEGNTALELRSTQAVMNIEDYAMTTDVLIRQAAIIEEVAQKVMRENVHYGKIPGCGDKPTLLKPGAEKLAVTFRLSPSYEVEEKEMDNGHRQFNVTCRLVSIVTGAFIGAGVGSCSTMESKYRFRAGAGELTGVPVPKSYWDTRKTNPGQAVKILKDAANKAGIDGDKFGTKKNDAGMWEITTHGEKVEHDNPADYYNTCLKMAKKRAMVDGILSCTAASDVFTQDIEELVENGVMTPKETPKAATQQRQPEPQAKAPAPEQNGNNITDKQVKLIMASMKPIHDKEQARALFKDFFGIQHLADLPKTEMDNAILWIKDRIEEGM